jgi:hypothetical protein
MTHSEVSSDGVEVLDSLVVHSDERMIAVELVVRDDDLAVAAFGDGTVPSLILTNSFGLSPHERKNFAKISFPELKGFKIWSCDASEGSLKICFLKSGKTDK